MGRATAVRRTGILAVALAFGALAVPGAATAAQDARAHVEEAYVIVHGSGAEDFIVFSRTGSGDVLIVNRGSSIVPLDGCRQRGNSAVLCTPDPERGKFTIEAYGEGGDDHVSGKGLEVGDDVRHTYFLGDNGDDVILGTAGKDSIFDGDGDDRVNGAGGNDYLIGYPGADSLFGGDGDDTIEAELAGGHDPDRKIDCGDGRDRVYFGDEDPALKGCEVQRNNVGPVNKS